MNRVDRLTRPASASAHQVDPVALLVETLSGLSAKHQKTALQRAMRVYVEICLEAYPNMSPEEMVHEFTAVARAAKARLAEMKGVAA